MAVGPSADFVGKPCPRCAELLEALKQLMECNHPEGTNCKHYKKAARAIDKAEKGEP